MGVVLFGLTGLGCRDGAATLLTGLGDFAAADFRGLTRRVDGVVGFLGTLSASSSASTSASGVSGLILGVHDDLLAGGARTKGLGVPWGVAEKMLAKGCCGLEQNQSINQSINLCRLSQKNDGRCLDAYHSHFGIGPFANGSRCLASWSCWRFEDFGNIPVPSQRDKEREIKAETRTFGSRPRKCLPCAR